MDHPIFARLETCASESENGRNFADTPQALREAAAMLRPLLDAAKIINAGHGCPSAVARDALEKIGLAS
jgi:hypothetical protein